MTYGQYAHRYRQLGYSPIPLPPRAKKPVPDGWTGREGLFASGPDIQEWIDNGKADGNIALRLPDGVIGIDVDNYGAKTGGDSMTKAVEMFGRPGSSGRLTSRYEEDKVSGIRLFRVPPGTILASTFAAAGLGPDVEIIQFHHRYAVGPGSIHPDTGQRYEWVGAHGIIGELPAVADLPELPAAWIEGLQAKSPDTRADVEHAAYDAMDDVTQGKVQSYMERALAGVYADLEAMKSWPEGHRDENGWGWEEGVLQKTLRLAQWVKADWNTLSTDEVLRDLRRHAPVDADFPMSASLGKFVRAVNNDKIAPMTYPLTDDVDLLSSAPNRSSGKASAGDDADPDGDIYSAEIVGGSQYAIRFNTTGCRRTETKDDGRVVEKEVLPATTAARIARVHPIAKQPLSKAQNWWSYRDGVWGLNDSIVRLSLAVSFGDAYKTSDVAPVEDILSTMVQELDIKPHKDFINFRNGMLEWRTGELHEHDPKFRSTVQLPHKWNPDAECPKFDAWLEERLPGTGVQLAWELIAASLYNGLVNQRAGLLYGVGNSGKSTYLDVILGLVGPKNVSALAPQDLTKTVFATHSLLGKQLNLVTDIDPTKITETAVFKRAVAGEPMQAQQKNKPEFTFRPFANHLYSANQIPRSSDRTSAWTRRFAILRFEHAIAAGTRIVERYDRVLLEEAEGIIAKAVRVLPDLVWQGDFSIVPEDQFEFESATDFTRDFWEDAVTITGNGDDFASTVQLAQAFDLWCNQHRIKSPPPFADVELRLRDDTRVARGRKRLTPGRASNPARGWKGVSINPEYRTRTELQNPLDKEFGGVPDEED